MTDLSRGAAPLDGLKAVSLAQNLPGPVALALLVADGISATKIESPSGDMLRQGAPDWYEELHRGCEIRMLDLRAEEARTELFALLAEADLLITSQRPSGLARLGITAEALARRNDRLCWVEIVGDCDSPDAPGHDLTYQAEVGLLAPPAMPRSLIADLGGARDAAQAALALLLGRQRGSSLRHRRIGLKQAAEGFAAPVRHKLTSDGGVLSGALPGYRLYRLADGWAAIAALEPHFAATFMGEIGEDPTGFFAEKTVAEAEAFGRAHDLPISAVSVL